MLDLEDKLFLHGFGVLFLVIGVDRAHNDLVLGIRLRRDYNCADLAVRNRLLGGVDRGKIQNLGHFEGLGLRFTSPDSCAHQI